MNVFDLVGVLTIDTQAYKRGLKDAEKHGKSFADNQSRSLGSKIGGGLKKAAKVGAAAMVGAGAVVGKFYKDAIQESISYESAFTGVMKTVDETATTSYDDISKAIKKMATETASSQEDIAGVAEVAGQLGVSADDIASFTKTIVELGDTTNLSAEEAASALAKFTNITGDGQASVDRIGSAIVDLGNNFATTEADIVNMSSRLASAGTIAGLSSTDILGLSTAMSSVGINAEAGGTAMSQVLNKIGKAVDAGFNDKKLKLFAATSGMTAEQFSSAWKSSPVEALSSFIKGLDSAQKSGTSMNSILDQLGISGIRESNTVRSLALASDVMASAIDTANTAFEENVALTNEAEKRYGTTESKINQMQSSMKNLQLAMVNGLSPAFNEVTNQGTNAINELAAAFESGGITGFMTKLGDVFTNGLSQLLTKLPQAINTGASLLMSVVQGITQNIPLLSNAVIQIVTSLVNNLLVAAPDVLQAGIDLFAQLGDGLAEVLPILIPKIVDLVVQLAQRLVDNADKIIDAGVNLLGSLAESIPEVVEKLAKAIPQLIIGLITALTSEDNITKIINAGVDILKALIDSIPVALESIVEALPQIIEGIVTALLEGIPALIEGGIELISALVEDIPTILENILKVVPKIIEGLFKALTKKGNLNKIFKAGFKLVGKVISGFLSIVGSLGSKLWEFIDGIIKYFASGEVVDDLKGAGEAIMNALWDGLKGIWEGISGWVTGIVDWAGEQFKKIVDFMQNIVSAIGIGMSDADAAEAAAERGKNREQNIKVVNAYTSQNLGDKGYSIKNEEDGTKIYDSKGNDVTNRFVRQSGRPSSRFDLAPTTDIKTTQTNADLSKQIEDLSASIDKLSKSRQDTQIILNNRELGRAVRSYA